MEPAIVSENHFLREEIERLNAEKINLLNQLNEARRTPAIPESAIRAVWEHGYLKGLNGRLPTREYADHSCEIGRIFTEALKRG